jgi:hypothetical protein
MARFTYYQENKETEPILCKISTAKKLLKEKGGHAWTEHYERDGGLFEVTQIELTGNNSKFKYNQHL